MSEVAKRVAALSPEKRKLLLQQVQKQKKSAALAQIPVQKRETDVFPLSFAQQRLWFLDQLSPGSVTYLIPKTRRIRGTLHMAVLERSLFELLKRHEVLRTTFRAQDGKPVQVVHAAQQRHIPLIDLHALASDERAYIMQRLTKQEAQQPCNLEEGPLLRIHCLSLADDDSLLLVTMHHIISDAWSDEIFYRELTELYQAFIAGLSSPLPPLPIQYVDFALWQRTWLQGEILDSQLTYWKKRLAAAPVLELPTDHMRPAVSTSQGAAWSLQLPASLLARLTALSQKEGVTLFILLLTTFQILLMRYSGQTDISVGSPIANRTRTELEGLIGFFVNTLVLRTDLSENPTFRELLARVHEVALGAYAHQEVPFEQLVELLRPERDLNRPPFFQVLFSAVQQANSQERATALLTGQEYTEYTTAKFDLEMNIGISEYGLLCTLMYSTDVFTSSTIQSMLTHFRLLLESISANPEQKITRLSLLTAAERQKLVREINNTAQKYPLQCSLAQLFAGQVQMGLDRIAVGYGDVQLTYQALDLYSNQLAQYLIALGVGPEVLVGVYMERSIDMAIVLLGIFKAGGAYIPFEPSSPIERLIFTLQDALVQLVLTHDRLLAPLPILPCPAVSLESIWPLTKNYTCKSLAQFSTTELLAYVIYTSGSTGQPKGAAIIQRGMLNHLYAKIETLSLYSGDTIAQTASHCFDISVWQFFAALLVGGRVWIFPDEIAHNPLALFTQSVTMGITVLEVVPSLLRTSLEEAEQWREAVEVTRSLRWLVATGEQLSAELGTRWLQCYPQIALLNAYGPTECSDDVTHAFLSLDMLKGGAGAPIGQAIANTQIYIVDNHLELVPRGVPGQICVGGIGVGRGYLGDAVRTAITFVPDPFSAQAGSRLYLTGDLGRYREDWQIEFLGRLDQQIKLRGYRIEPGEIEAALEQHQAIREALVIVSDSLDGHQNLVAYVVTREGEALPEHEELRAHLRERVPHYMVPTRIMVLDAFPLTANGKLDRKALPAPMWGETLQEEADIMTPIEELLIGIWCEVLGLSAVGRYDNFFELGGHSLLATQLIARVRTTLQIDIPLSRLFEMPTVRELGNWLEQALRGEQLVIEASILPVPRTQELPLSFAQQRLWFLDQLTPESTTYLMPGARRVHGDLDAVALERSLGELILRHESLRTTFPTLEGRPAQVIRPVGLFRLPFIDLSVLPWEQRREEAQKLTIQEARHPADLALGPLFRVFLLHLDSSEHVLLFTMHHIISDGWSNDIFSYELNLLYQAFSAGKVSPLSPLPVQYADFALWQRQWLQGEVLETQLAYWQRQLAEIVPLELPTDRSRPSIQTFQGAVQVVMLPQELRERLRVLSQQEGVTLFMLLLAAFQVLLMRYSGQTDISVGSPIANRTRPELEGIIGFFVNTLVLRSDLSGDPAFTELLRKVRQMALGAYAHQDVPFEKLVEMLQPERDLSRSPLFQVMFVMQQTTVAGKMEVQQSSALTLSRMNVEHITTKFDLAFSITTTANGLHCNLEYSVDLFDAETIAQFLEHWQILLEGIVTNPHCRLSELSLLSTRQRQLLLHEWNTPLVAPPTIACLPTLFDTVVQHYPDAIAVASHSGWLTYRALNEYANRLAFLLQEAGVTSEVLVGLYGQRSVPMLVALLAVLKAGGGFVPCDSAYPQQRLAYMLSDAGVGLLITDQSPETVPDFPDMRIFSLHECWSQLQQSKPTVSRGPEYDNVAYVIYTSGSTGKPKGVQVTHRGVGNLIEQQQANLGIEPESRILQFASWSFDAFFFEVVMALLSGASLHLEEADALLPGFDLLHTLRERAITVVTLPPSALRVLPDEELLPDLKTIIVAGEVCREDLVNLWAKGRCLYNAYGPTEATVWSTVKRCYPGEDRKPPIGRAIGNVEVYVLDEHGFLLPPGVAGELYIGGISLARGYLGRADLTAERFVPDAWSGRAGERLYRTGDRVRYNREGELEFIGRLDYQVKVRGYRIELAEIEAVLEQHPSVLESVVIVREDVVQGACLVAYVIDQGEVGSRLNAEELAEHIRKQNPEYMVPRFFVSLENWPLNLSGKVDRRALPRPELAGDESEYTQNAPQTVCEKQLAAIWCEVLGRAQVGIHDNFFALGGDSIISIQVVAQAKRAGLRITARQLFQYQTIAQLAAVAEVGKIAQPASEQESLTGSVLLTPIQRWFFEQDLPERYHYNQAVQLEVSQKLRPIWLQQMLWHLLHQHDVLRLTFTPHASSWHQSYAAISPDLPFMYVDLSFLSAAQKPAVMKMLAGQAQASLCLEHGPLLRCVFFDRGAEEPGRLLFIIHHLVVDSVSWNILLADIEMLLRHLSTGREVHLPVKTTSFQRWAQQLQQYAQSSSLQQEIAYWLTEKRRHVLPLSQHVPPGVNTVANSRTITVSLCVEETRALLQDVSSVYHMRINEILLAALTRAFALWTGRSSLLVDMEGHGREEILDDVDLSHTVGWFTTIFPLLLDIEQAKTPEAALKAVKEQMRQVPQHGIGYGLLRYMGADPVLSAQLAHLPQAQVLFNYLGWLDAPLSTGSVQSSSVEPALIRRVQAPSGLAFSPLGTRSHLLEINGGVVGGQMSFVWQYCPQIHTPDAVQMLAKSFIDGLCDFIAHGQSPEANGYTPSDFSLAALNQSTLDKIVQHVQQVGGGKQIEDIYPLSPMQDGLLFHCLYAPEADVYCSQSGWVLEGAVDVSAWKRAWQEVTNRHAILRTLFLWQELSQPLQVVCRDVEIPWNFYDWSNLSQQEQQVRIQALQQKDRRKGFELDVAPLQRLTMIRLGEQSYYCLYSLHHLLLDGWSQPILLREVQTCYQAYCEGKMPDLAAVRPYRDYIVWLQQQDTSSAEQFWRKYLAGFTVPISLEVTAHALRNHESRKSAMQSMQVEQCRFSQELTEKLLQFAQRHQLTMNTFVQGAWGLLLARYSGETDIVFGATVAGRPAELSGIASMIGIFINTLPVRIQIDWGLPLIDWLSRLQFQQAEVRQYEYTSLAQIQRWSEVPVDQPLFESLLMFQNYPGDASRREYERERVVKIRAKHAVEHTNYPLSLTAGVLRGLLHAELSYDNARFESVQAQRLLTHLQVLLEAMVTPEHIRLRDLPLLIEADRQHALIDWNATRRDYPLQFPFVRLFEQQAALNPDCIAVSCSGAHLTYQELDRRASQLAHHLLSLLQYPQTGQRNDPRQTGSPPSFVYARMPKRLCGSALGVGPEKLVGLYMERSIEMLMAMLAIFKAGAAYIPLDPAYPERRLAFILQEANVQVVITQPTLATFIASIADTVVCLEAGGQALSAYPIESPRVFFSPDQLAYVIYTSGSTGLPKGAMVTQVGMLNHLFAKIEALQLDSQDMVAQTASHCFDISIWQFLAALLKGAQVQIIPDEITHDSLRLFSSVEVERISILEVVPSLLRAYLDVETVDTQRTSPLGVAECSVMRWLLVTGEMLSADVSLRWLQRYPDVALLNAYGPTECSDDVTHALLVSSQLEDVVTAPIGEAIANTQIYILDRDLQPVPPGVLGEICVGGVGVGRGYLGNPIRSAEVFVPDPFSAQEGARLYRTGDIGRYRSAASIEFIRRVDQQIKVRGYRIELGEIEAVLEQHPEVSEQVVVVRESRSGDQQLVAYVVFQQGSASSFNEALLRDYLRQCLPHYMVPTFIVMLEALPLTANGKIDRSALPVPGEDEMARKQGTVNRMTPIEELLAEIWCAILGCSQAGPDDNFFESGGHSLLATRLIARIRAVLHVEIPLRSLFESPTLAGLALHVERALRGGAQLTLPPLVPLERPDLVPLSFAQQRLWFLDQLEPGNVAYLIPGSRRLGGWLDVAALERSLSTLIDRHESLRTTFQMYQGQPIQVIHPAHPFLLSVIDLSALPAYEREQEARFLIRQEALHPCDLERGPLLRFSLLRLQPEEHVFLLTMHHIISDGWSNDIFFSELTLLYQAFEAGQPSPLAPLPIQYADFTLWQRSWLRDEALERQLSYWRQQLQGVQSLEFPTDYPRPQRRTFQGASVSVLLPAELRDQLLKLGREEGTTLFMLLLAAFQVLLMRYSGQTDISVGSPIANRTRAELEGLIGFFVNTLVLRTNLAGNPSFLDVLSRVREVALGAYAHQDVPFEQLVEALQPERDMSRSPLFQVLFQVLQPSILTQGVEQRNIEGLSIGGVSSGYTTTKFDLTFTLTNNARGLHCDLIYSTDLFAAATMAGLLQHWVRLLEEIVASPDQCVSEIPLLSTDEVRTLVEEWNDTAGDYPANTCLQKLFEAQAERRADTVALVFGEEQVTYCHLNECANRLAHALRKMGVEEEVAVGICLERSVAMIVAVLGILKAGGIYLPLDVSSPAERLVYMLHDAQARMVLTQAELVEKIGAAEVLHWCMDSDWCRIACESAENPRWDVAATCVAYVLYTSGSTGTPKGVMIEHRHLVNYVFAVMARTRMEPLATFALVQPLTVDSCLTMLFPPLFTGGTLHLIAKDCALDAQAFSDYCRRQPMDYLKIAPSHLAVLLQGKNSRDLLPRRRLIIGGEASQWEWVREVQSMLPVGAQLYNHYGPTETTVGSLVFPLEDMLYERETGVTPIGRPLMNTQVYVLDRRLQLVPVGCVGELYLGGASLARGYMGRAELTAERFIPNPFGDERGSRLYKTGDIVRYREDGNVEFVGRGDEQVKIRGYRIELGEIEAVLWQHPAIQEVVVLAQENKTAGGKRVVAYIVGKQGEVISIPELHAYAGKKLPDYMVPSTWRQIEALPLTPHGKVDRKALQVLKEEGEEAKTGAELAGARTSLEEILLGLWSQVLHARGVGVEDNFFALGGHSLLATQLISRIRAALQIELPLRALFEFPTVGSLARKVESVLQGEAGMQETPLLPVARQMGQALPLSFAQQRLWFLDHLEPGNTAYLVADVRRIHGILHIKALEQSVDALVERHESLRTTFHESQKTTSLVRVGQPAQVIHAPQHFQFPLIDLSTLPLEERRSVIRYLAMQEASYPCNLEQGPLLRLSLLRLESQEHVLLVTMHHIITDGWSMQIFYHELSLLYRAFVAGQPSPLMPLPLQYADYAIWQRQWLREEVLETLLAYWRRQLADVAPLELPTDHARPVTQSYHGAVHTFTLSLEVSQALTTLSRQEEVTLFMTLLAAFQVLFHRYRNQTDIVVGTDSANRNHVETESLIGFFINILVLRTNLGGKPDFCTVLRRVREMVLDAYSRRELPFDLLVEKLAPSHVSGKIPLVNVLFVMQNIPTLTEAAGKSHSEVNEARSQVIPEPRMDEVMEAKFDLALFMQERAGRLHGALNYSLDLFDPDTIATMMARFSTLLQSIVQQPQVSIDQLDFFTEIERKQQEQEERSLRQTLVRRSHRRLASPEIDDERFELPDIRL